MVDSSAFGIGTVLIPAVDKDQLQVFSYKTQIITQNDQKPATLHRKQTTNVCIWEKHEVLIISSKRPAKEVHRSQTYSWFFRSQTKDTSFSRYQSVPKPLPKLVTFWPQGQNVSWAELFTRKIPTEL